PTLGGWLTDNFGWRWCFYINLPVGALCALGIFLLLRPARPGRRDQFDLFGFAMLTLAVGSMQLMLDRGQLKDWFHSTEIWIEGTVAALCFYLLLVHTMTAGERSFLNRELMKSPNFVAGSLLMFGVGMILSGTLALMPTMMQVLLNYPVFDAGWIMAPRRSRRPKIRCSSTEQLSPRPAPVRRRPPQCPTPAAFDKPSVPRHIAGPFGDPRLPRTQRKRFGSPFSDSSHFFKVDLASSICSSWSATSCRAGSTAAGVAGCLSIVASRSAAARASSTAFC